VKAAVISVGSGIPIVGSRHRVKNMAISMESFELNDANYIASHADTPAFVLHRLAKHCNVDVRLAVADNKNTHTLTTMQLALDNNPDIRYALAENHQIDSNILNVLAMDDNPFVADRAQKTLSRLNQAVPAQYLL